MSAVTIYFRDGTKKEMPEQSRAGGSYYQKVRYEPGAVIVEDVWGGTTAFPLDLVLRVETTSSERSRW